jgi:hypothetical protein
MPSGPTQKPKESSQMSSPDLWLRLATLILEIIQKYYMSYQPLLPRTQTSDR